MNQKFMLTEGETRKTLSGRTTTPFPKLNFKTNISAGKTIKRVDTWLMQNALDEAIANKNRLAELDFRHNLENPQQANKDAAHLYLFGVIF
jgi:hypothetical protein